jgi:hypothetical protein
MPMLLLCVTLQADGDEWSSTAVDAYRAGRWDDRGRDQAPAAPCGVACAILFAILERPGRAQVTSTGTDANRWSQ